MRDDLDRLRDMSEMCELLMTHASDAHALEHDPVVQAAAQRWIEVLGEAASHVSDEFKAAHTEIPWRERVGVRVVLAHAYHHIDQDIVGTVVSRHIPALKSDLDTIIGDIDDDG